MRLSRLLPLTLAACLAAACSTILQTKVHSDPAADFSKYKTFAVKQDRLQTADQAWLTNQLTTRLEGKGLTPAASNPDLQIVTYSFRNQSTSSTSGYGWWTGGLTTESTENIPAGTLVVDLVDQGKVDPGHEQLVWRGMAIGTIPPTGGLKRDKVTLALDRLFSDYPPKKAKS
ncbi:MAG TPA: DUF4136 domain-containing protein [Thermoanaerobaculia bacterium]|jgi:hypothetical protein